MLSLLFVRLYLKEREDNLSTYAKARIMMMHLLLVLKHLILNVSFNFPLTSKRKKRAYSCIDNLYM